MNILKNERVTKALKTVATYAISATVIVGVSLASAAYGKWKATKDARPALIIQPAVCLKNVSIAVNERNEMLVIDRKTGEYVTYQDSVGLAIFGMYAGRLYTNKAGQ